VLSNLPPAPHPHRKVIVDPSQERNVQLPALNLAPNLAPNPALSPALSPVLSPARDPDQPLRIRGAGRGMFFLLWSLIIMLYITSSVVITGLMLPDFSTFLLQMCTSYISLMVAHWQFFAEIVWKSALCDHKLI